MDEHTRTMFEALQAGILTRRQFVQRMAALGFAGGTISLFLAACGNTESVPPATASTGTGAAKPTAPAVNSNAAATTALPAAQAPVPTPAPIATQSAPPTSAAGNTSSGTASASTTTNASAGADAGILKSPDPNPKRGGTLTLAFGVTTSNYDMQQGATNTVLCHMYNNLIRLNIVDGLKTIVPDLAEKWDMTPDGLSYTFKLRSGVQFHDGTPLSSADVVATYNRMIFPPRALSVS